MAYASSIGAVAANLISSFLQDSSDEDDEMVHAGIMQELEGLMSRPTKANRIKFYVESVIPGYSNIEFRQHFRMNFATYESLEGRILANGSLVNTSGTGRHRISHRKQLLAVIWLLATPDSFRSIADRFDLSKSSLEKSFQTVISELETMASEIILWPTGQRLIDTVEGFKKTADFSGVIGAIDGTHINIKAPQVNPASYVNRKHVHSMLLQGVCDHNLQFIDCFAGYPGSVHDARLLRNSPLYQDVQQNILNLFPHDTHLIGDPAYPLDSWLLVAYRDNGHLTAVQKKFNLKLSMTRSVIERAFALLKGRFRRLKFLDMNRVDLIPRCIMACCVLHNICLGNEGVEEGIDDYIENGLDPDSQLNAVDRPEASHTGNFKRNAIALNL